MQRISLAYTRPSGCTVWYCLTMNDVQQKIAALQDRGWTLAANGVSNSLQGKVITIHPPQRQNPMLLFFTKEHAAYWLTSSPSED